MRGLGNGTNIEKTEDEKKVIAPLLGKLYVSPASTESMIRELYEEVEGAVDSKLLSDATSRNALYKIHVALGKIVNALGEQQDAARRTSRSTSVSTSVLGEDRTVMEDRTVVEDRTAVRAEPDIKEEEEESDGTLMPAEEQNEGDSLVEDLLSDEEV